MPLVRRFVETFDRYDAVVTPSMVRRFVETFDGYDAVVTPSASCAGTIVHHHAKIAAERGTPRCATVSPGSRRGPTS